MQDLKSLSIEELNELNNKILAEMTQRELKSQAGEKLDSLFKDESFYKELLCSQEYIDFCRSQGINTLSTEDIYNTALSVYLDRMGGSHERA